MQSILDENYKNYFYTDVMARGKYPSYTERMFKELGVTIEKEEGDDELLRNNTVDFLSYSYYMSMISSNDPNYEITSGNLLSGKKNPYLPVSDWGWQIDLEAVEDGVDLLGYTMWGIIDIVSCGTIEMSKRYGVIYVDRDDAGKGSNKRFKKDSFSWYQRCIASNGKGL